MNVMNGRVPICRQVEYIIVSNNIMFMSLLALLAYMLRMLLVLAYMLRLMLVPMYMIHVAPKLIVLIVLPNMLLRNMLLIVLMNMRAMSAYANVWNFRINNQLVCHDFVKLCPHKCSKLLN